MKDIQHFIPGKNNFDGFIARLSKFQKLFASVAKGYNNYAFEEVTADSQISLNYVPTVLPPKKYVMPQQETLMEHDFSKGLDVQVVNRGTMRIHFQLFRTTAAIKNAIPVLNSPDHR